MSNSAFQAQLDQQEQELRDRLGAMNGRFSKNPITEFTGPVAEGIMVSEPRYRSFRAYFPHSRQTRFHGVASGHLVTDLIVSREHAGTVCSAFSIAALAAPASQYQNNPKAFAAAINRIVHPGIQINWTYFERPLAPLPETGATAELRPTQMLDVFTPDDLIQAMAGLYERGFQRNLQLDVADEDTASIFFVNGQAATRINYRGPLHELTWEAYFREDPRSPWQRTGLIARYYQLIEDRDSAFNLAARQFGPENAKLVVH